LGVLALLFNARVFVLGSARKMAKAPTATDAESPDCAKELPAWAKSVEVQQSFLKFLAVCVTAGILSTAWSPVSVWATNSRGLHIYQVIFFFHFGMVLPLPLLLLQTRGQTRFWGGKREAFLCVIAGMMDCLGRILMFVSGSAVSFAMAFGIVCCSPVVASLEGVVFGEMRGAGAAEIAHFCAMLLSYCLAVALLALSHT
jgi:glucose uptake protein GlcU